MDAIHFDVRFATVTGSVVWDQPDANRMIQRFMPSGREHGPMIGILHIGAFRPTPNVLMDAIVTFGEDLRAGRYGNFTLVVSSSDEATRTVVSNIASAHNVAMFVSPSPDSPSPTHLAQVLKQAEPVGDITEKERETLNFVLRRAGGTVTAAQLAQQLDIEQTTAGNRLISLHKKGYLQRIKHPHPSGDQYADPRSVRFDLIA